MNVYRVSVTCVLLLALGVTLVLIVSMIEQLHGRAAADSVDGQFSYMAPPEEKQSDVSIGEEVTPTDNLVRGVVEDSEGRAVEGAVVAVIGKDDVDASRATLAESGRLAVTGPNGSFAVTKPRDGEWCVSARHPSYLPAVVDLNDPAVHLLVVLHEGYRIEGTVLGAGDDIGVEGVRVAARGVGASFASASSQRVPGPRAAVQHAVTGPDGSFVIAGLEAGWYQIEVVEDGLMTMPSAAKAGPGPWTLPAERATFARAPSSGVVLRALPLAAVALDVRDVTSGAAVPWAWIRVTMDGKLWPWSGSIGVAGNTLSANGHILDMEGGYTQSGGYGMLFVSPEWPVKASVISCEVSAPGFEKTQEDLPVQIPGRGVAPTLVMLKPLASRGRVRWTLCDRRGVPVGPLGAVLHLQDVRTQERLEIRQWFNKHGDSAFVSLPMSTYRMVSAVDEQAEFSGPEFVVSKDEGLVRLHITRAAMRIRVVDERGKTVEGSGLRIGPGAGPVRTVYSIEGGALAIRGLWLRPPGVGFAGEALVAYPLAGGQWTLEAYRHGYEPVQMAVQLADGHVEEVIVKMVENAECLWNTWSTTPANRLEDVAPTRDDSALR